MLCISLKSLFKIRQSRFILCINSYARSLEDYTEVVCVCRGMSGLMFMDWTTVSEEVETVHSVGMILKMVSKQLRIAPGSS